MNNHDALDSLNSARAAARRSARRGAFATAVIAASLIIAIGVVVDLEMLWLLALVVLGYVGLSVARPLKLRLNWSDRTGAVLFVASALAAVAVYLLVQALARSATWPTPNTVSALAAAGMIFLACLPALVRLATPQALLGAKGIAGHA